MARRTDLGDLKTLYLIHGTEEFELKRAEARLRDRLAAVADLDFNLDVFDGDSATGDAIVAAANTLPFMSERRLVIVRGVDRMPAARTEALASYAADPSPSTVLVLSATKVDKRSRLYKAVDANGQVAEYKAPKRSEYAGRVAEMFSEHGCGLESGAAQAMVDAVGLDLRRLAGEVEKVVAYKGAGSRLSRQDVEEVVAKTAPVSVFSLNDALGRRDATGALEAVAALTADGESIIRLHALAVSHVRTLLSVSSLMARGERSAGVAAALKRPDWQVRNLMDAARRYEPVELEHALRAAARSEAQMKTSPVDTRLVFERWLVAMCAAG
jgi:DNA polymerase-3 subunit delta